MVKLLFRTLIAPSTVDCSHTCVSPTNHTAPKHALVQPIICMAGWGTGHTDLFLSLLHLCPLWCSERTRIRSLSLSCLGEYGCARQEMKERYVSRAYPSLLFQESGHEENREVTLFYLCEEAVPK